MKHKSIILSAFLLCGYVVKAQINQYTFNGNGIVNISKDFPHSTIPGHYVYPGEEITILFSGTVRHNWWEEKKKKCVVKALGLFCKRYKIVHNNFKTHQQLPPKIFLFDSDNKDITGGGIQLSSTGAGKYIIPKTSSFENPLSLKMVIAPSGVDIKREKSDGHYNVKITVNSKNRLTYLDNRLSEIKDNLTIQVIKNKDFLDQHLLKDKPVEVAELLLDHINYYDLGTIQEQQILKYVSHLAPQNPDINIKLANSYRGQYDFENAEASIKKALILLKDGQGTNTQIAEAYEALGLVYFEKREGLKGDDLLQAVNFLGTAAEYYRKDIKVERMIGARLDQVSALRRINSINALKQTSKILEELQAFQSPLQWIEKNGKYGYADDRGNIKIEPKYSHVLGFSEHLAPVKLDEKWGFIDKGGSFVITPRFEEAYPFTDGFAIVKLNGNYGYIDYTGKLLIPAQYKKAYPFKEGIGIVEDEEYAIYINRQGKIIVKVRIAHFDRHVPTEHSIAHNLEANFEWISDREEAYRYAFKRDIEKEINSSGNTRITISWPTAVPFEKKYKLYDENYNLLDEQVYDDIRIVNDYTYFLKGNSSRYEKQDGSILHTEGANNIGAPLGEGNCLIFFDKTNGLFGLWDNNGKIILKSRYKGYGDFVKGGLAAQKTDNSWVIVNEKGQEIYTSNKELRENYIGEINKKLPQKMVSFHEDWKEGVINTDTGEIIFPFVYKRITLSKVNSQIAILENFNKEFTIIDLSGNLILPKTSKYVYEFKNGMINLSYQDDTGKRVVELWDVKNKNYFALNGVTKFDNASELEYNRILIHLEDSMYVVDKKMKVLGKLKSYKVEEGISPSIYQALADGLWEGEYNQDKILYTLTSEDSKMGVMNRNGKLLVPVEFDEVEYVNDNIFLIRKGVPFESGFDAKLLDFSGNMVRDKNVFGALRISQNLPWVLVYKTNYELQIIDEKNRLRGKILNLEKYLNGRESTNAMLNNTAIFFDADGNELFNKKINDIGFRKDKIYLKHDGALTEIDYEYNLSKLTYSNCQANFLFKPEE